MSYKLNKPYTEKERMDFIVEYNHKKGLYISKVEDGMIALEADEMIENGVPVKNPNYNAQKAKEEIKIEIQELKDKLVELDSKRIRAVCENEIKDETTGETWLEHYNKLIRELRTQITDLLAKIE